MTEIAGHEDGAPVGRYFGEGHITRVWQFDRQLADGPPNVGTVRQNNDLRGIGMAQ